MIKAGYQSPPVDGSGKSHVERPTANVRPKRTPRRCPTRETTMRQAWKRAKVWGRKLQKLSYRKNPMFH